MTDDRRAEAQLARVKTGFKLRRQQRRQANAVQQYLAANDLQESVVEFVRARDGWVQVRRWPGEWLPALTRFEASVGMVVLTATIGDAPMVFGPHPDDGGEFRARDATGVTTLRVDPVARKVQLLNGAVLESYVDDGATPGGGGLTKRYTMGAPAAGDTVPSPVNVVTDYASSYIVPAGDMVPGRIFKIWAAGLYTINAAGGALAWQLRLGTTSLVGDTVNFGATARTNRPWRFDFTVTVITAGAAGAVEATGNGRLFLGPNSTYDFELFKTTATTVDTTVAQRLGLSVNSNNGSVTTQQREFVVLAA